jgi:hypothetical protein
MIKITDDLRCNDPLMAKKAKVSMLHPYAANRPDRDVTKEIEVDVQGEFLNGKPHGLCFLFFKYNGELGPKASSSSLWPSDPYLDGHVLSFKGVGVLVDGVVSDGPAFFVTGHGYSLSFSWMNKGRPALSS